MTKVLRMVLCCVTCWALLFISCFMISILKHCHHYFPSNCNARVELIQPINRNHGKEANLLSRFFLAFVAFVPLFMHSQAAVNVFGLEGFLRRSFFFHLSHGQSLLLVCIFLGEQLQARDETPRICHSDFLFLST